MFKIKKLGKKKPKKGRWRMEDVSKQKPQEKPKLPPGVEPISPEDERMVKGFMESKIGQGLMRSIEPICRRDKHHGNLQINFVKPLSSLDITFQAIDLNTPLLANLYQYLWVNRMSSRWDGSTGNPVLTVRWFLPYEQPKNMQVDSDNLENLQPTAEEEVGQTKQSTIEENLEGPVRRMVEEALEETQKEMADEK